MTQQPDSTTSSPAPSQDQAAPTFYERVGGHDTFRRLVHEFYRGVADDPPLKEMYPEEDLGPAEDRLRLFLEQYWGGPTTYQETRGHPRLRMRHVPYRVTPTQRDRWLHHMHAAIDSIGDRLTPMDELLMRDYMNRAAESMVNAHDD